MYNTQNLTELENHELYLSMPASAGRDGRRPRRCLGVLLQCNGCLLQRVCRKRFYDAEVDVPHPRGREDLLWQLLLSANQGIGQGMCQTPSTASSQDWRM